MVNQFNIMALKLFVDPNEGARAYARGIEKAFDSVGDAVGGILQSYNDARVKKQQLLGTLAAYDHDNVKGQKEYLVQQNDKDRQNVLLGHYERKYETLSSMEGALQRVAIQREKADRAYQEQVRDQEYRINEAKIEQINVANKSRADAGNYLKDIITNSDKHFSFTNNIFEDDAGPVKKLNEVTRLANAYPDLPESRQALSLVDSVMASAPYMSHTTQKQARAQAYQIALQDADLYTQYFGPEIQAGVADKINVDELTRETFNGIRGPESLKIKQGRFAQKYVQYMSQAAAPGYMLDAMGVPSIEQMQSEGRMPTLAETRRMEDFDKRYKAGDLSLMNGVNDTRTIMQLSAMNVDPETGKPIKVTENDEDEIASIIQANTNIKDLLAMLGDEEQEEFTIGGKKIGVVETGKLNTAIDKFKRLMSPSGQRDIPLNVFRAQLKASVSNIARGIFMEVGVLTDADVDRYMAIMADPNNTVEMNQILSEMLLKTVRDKSDTLFSTLARGGKNVAGYMPVYASLQSNLSLPLDDLIPMAQQGRLLPGRELRVFNPQDQKVYGYTVTSNKDLYNYLSDLKADVASALETVEKPAENPVVSSTLASPEDDPVQQASSKTKYLEFTDKGVRPVSGDDPGPILSDSASRPSSPLPAAMTGLGMELLSRIPGPEVKSGRDIGPAVNNLLNEGIGARMYRGLPGGSFGEKLGILRDAVIGSNYFNNPGKLNIGGYYKFPDQQQQQKLQTFFREQGGSIAEFQQLIAAASAGDPEADRMLRQLSYQAQQTTARRKLFN